MATAAARRPQARRAAVVHRLSWTPRGSGSRPGGPLTSAGRSAVVALLDQSRSRSRSRSRSWSSTAAASRRDVEIRVCDVNADLDVVLLLTALVRGLATTLLLDIGDERPPPDVPTRRLHAPHRLAARNGPAGEGLDPARGEYVPAVTLAERLLARAAPWLASSSWRSCSTGCGAPEAGPPVSARRICGGAPSRGPRRAVCPHHGRLAPARPHDHRGGAPGRCAAHRPCRGTPGSRSGAAPSAPTAGFSDFQVRHVGSRFVDPVGRPRGDVNGALLLVATAVLGEHGHPTFRALPTV